MRALAFTSTALVLVLVLAGACGGNVSIGSIADGTRCGPTDCGPMPADAKVCPDGTSMGRECIRKAGACVAEFPECPSVDGGAGDGGKVDSGDACGGKVLPMCPRACTAFPETGACNVGDVCGNEIGDTCKCATGKWECTVHPPLGTGCNKVCEKVTCFDGGGAVLEAFRTCKDPSDCTSVRLTTDCCGNALVTGVRVDSAASVKACGQARADGFPKCGCPSGPAKSDVGTTENTPGSVPEITCTPNGTGVAVCTTKF